MYRQECYRQSQYENEQDNLLSSLLNVSPNHKQIPQHSGSVNSKQGPDIVEEQQEEEAVDITYKDILEVRLLDMQKEDSHCKIPQNLDQEMPEEELIMSSPSCKKGSEEMPTSTRKDSKLDKSAYYEETRRVKIDRYMMKKSRRVWGRKVSYDCRKVVADSRERVNGRFVKKSEESRRGSIAILANEDLLDGQQYYKEKNDFMGGILN